ncbi:MAG: bifunctional diaminohydroxyphosphoribosylaminopyrimidine deaminase/5-amino-6-(5-phosphoribosylamino)uracil reductase RibD [Blastocatellia bacterium]
MITTDQRFMRTAIRLARRGVNRSPSSQPLVGAILVAGGTVVGRGSSSQDHARSAIALALDEAGARAPASTLYTNIQPCCDGADPESCVRLLLGSRIARVVVGVTFHRPDQASANVLDKLRSQQVAVDTGVCEQVCAQVNEKYLKYSANGLPFVTVKFAQSLDGRIATAAGDSKWISSSGARRLSHRLRSEHDAILVGIGTVMADDPQLNVRLVTGRDPLRIVVDSRLRIPLTARVLAGGAANHTLVIAGEGADTAREREVVNLGAQVLRLPSSPAGINIERLIGALGRRGIASVLVEGGKSIVTSLLAARSVDRLVTVIAPKIIGQGTDAIGDLGITRLGDAITFSSFKTRGLGPDIIFDGRLNWQTDQLH